MNNPHKWAKEIKAWADGAEIQCRFPNCTEWRYVSIPLWDCGLEYRIKPRDPREWWLIYDVCSDQFRVIAHPAAEHLCGTIKVREVLE